VKRTLGMIMVLLGVGLCTTAWGRGQYAPPPYGAGLGGIGGWMESGPVWGWTDPFFGGDPTKDPPPGGGSSGGGGGREFDPTGGYQGGGGPGEGGGGSGGGGGAVGGDNGSGSCFRRGPGPGPTGGDNTYICACISYGGPSDGVLVGTCRKEGGGNYTISGCNTIGSTCTVRRR